MFILHRRHLECSIPSPISYHNFPRLIHPTHYLYCIQVNHVRNSITMPTSTTLWSPSSIDIMILTGAILAGCVAGVSLFLCWLDKQVPSLPVILSSFEPLFCVLLMDSRWTMLRLASSEVLGCKMVFRGVDGSAGVLWEFLGGALMGGMCRFWVGNGFNLMWVCSVEAGRGYMPACL